MNVFLSRWLDLGLTYEEGETKARVTKAERERLTELFAIATAAAVIPRRLGADATAAELSLDKKRCKRIAHVALQCAVAWGGTIKSNPPLTDVEAAQISWEQWWDNHRTWLTNRIRYISTWALQTGQDEQWAKSAVVRLMNELGWLEYAMR